VKRRAENNLTVRRDEEIIGKSSGPIFQFLDVIVKKFKESVLLGLVRSTV